MKKIINFIKSSKEIKKEKIKFYMNRVKFLHNRENKYIPDGHSSNRVLLGTLPKVSILMPIYNHADVAIFSIDSLLKQTYSNIEIIILDDGSKDNLLEKLKKYKDVSNIKIYTQKNQKLPRALTHLHQLASGDFITWTSADNIMHPKMIENLVRHIMLNPEAALVYGDVYVIGKNNRPYYGPCRDVDRDFKNPKIIRLSQSDKPLSIGTDNYINASFLYRKENSDVLMGIYKDDIIGAEDYDYWLRLQKSGNLVHVNNIKPLYYYRVHDNSMSHELETKKIKEHQSRLEKLRIYEQDRIKWCNIRANIVLDESVVSENIDDLLLQMPIYINEKNCEKNIYFTKNTTNKEKVYYLVDNDYYILKNSEHKKEIVKIFKGVDLPRETYKARNLFSHAFYHDDLIRIKTPILGCHINTKNLDVKNIEKILIENSDIYFVIVDEIYNKNIEEIVKKHSNIVYYPNKIYGREYQIYSYFSRIINFDNLNILNKYKTLMLAYGTGRRLNYDINDSFFNKFPFTVSFNIKINFSKSDGTSNGDYKIMDKYIEDNSRLGSLNKCVKFYNAHTQEMFIERPKYIVDNISKEYEPKRIK